MASTVTVDGLNRDLAELRPGTPVTVGTLGEYVLSVQRSAYLATLVRAESAPAGSRAAAAPAAPPSPCVAAHVLGAALFGLGAAAIDILLAANPELDVFTIVGISIPRVVLTEVQSLLEGGGAVEAVVSLVAQYVC
jgi:hypothetical protein